MINLNFLAGEPLQTPFAPIFIFHAIDALDAAACAVFVADKRGPFS